MPIAGFMPTKKAMRGFDENQIQNSVTAFSNSIGVITSQPLLGKPREDFLADSLRDFIRSGFKSETTNGRSIFGPNMQLIEGSVAVRFLLELVEQAFSDAFQGWIT